MKTKTKFATWLEQRLGERGMTAGQLAQQVNCHYSYVWKMLEKGKLPSRKLVMQIGEVFGDRQGALIAAGILQGTPLPEVPRPSPGNLIRSMRALEWLREAGFYTAAEVAFGNELLVAAMEWSRGPTQQAQQQEFEKAALAALTQCASSLMEQPAEGSEAIVPGKMLAELLPLRPNPIISVPRANLEALTVRPRESPASAYFLTRVFDQTRSPDFVELQVPIALLPVAVLRPIVDYRLTGALADEVLKHPSAAWVQLAEHKKELNAYKALLQEKAEDIDKAEKQGRVTTRELGMLWNHAKQDAVAVWDSLGTRFEILKSAPAFYDLIPLYQPPSEVGEAEVFVFSRTSGLVDPIQHYGDLVLKIPRPAYRIHPYRYAYFLNGIIRGCRSGCRVCYQLDGMLTVEAMRGQWSRRGRRTSRDKYLEEAARVLAKFLAEPNLEIRVGDFTKPPAGLKHFDWRNFLSVNTKRFVAIAGRHSPPPDTADEVQRKTFREIVHGALVDQRQFDEVLMKFNEALPDEIIQTANALRVPYGYALAKLLYEKSEKLMTLKEFEEYETDEKRAFASAKQKIRDLCKVVERQT
jgi:hypothetical protein